MVMGMLRRDLLERADGLPDRVPDAELGLAAILVGVAFVLATVLVPLIG